jgi:hypothetical protein
MLLRRTLAVLLLALPSSAIAGAPTELQVKAALVYNLAQFVDWPTSEVPRGTDPFVFGVLGSDDFRPVLEEIVQEKKLDQHRVEVRVFGRPEDVLGCQVLIVDLPEPRRKGAMRYLSTAGVLTIGEGEEFVREGGVIGLVLAENRIKFDINLGAADRAGLTVNATLLSLAHKIGRW